MKKAFTLIELLVVIAIIAILAAILFPVFAQAKLAAKKTVELSNVKQTNLGVAMYLNDYDDVYPLGCPNGWWIPSSTAFVEGVAPYLKNVPILQDSTDTVQKDYWPTWMGSPAVVIDVATNGNIVGCGTPEPGTNITGHNRGVIGMQQGVDVTSGGWMDTSTTNESSITQPAATIELTDRFGGQDIWGPATMVSGITGWDFVVPQALPDGTRAPNTPYTVTTGGGQMAKNTTITVNADQRFGAIATYTNQGIFSFTDGHAKTMSPTATRPVPTTCSGSTVNASQSDMWDALR